MTKRLAPPLFLLVGLSLVAAQPSPPRLRWLKGNMHTHTINSDGDSPPYDVVAWYKRQGYQFLVLTDHNTLTNPALFDTNPGDDFLLIAGEEITNRLVVHVNAIGITRAIPAQQGKTVTEILQSSIDAVRGAGGVPLINHPNFLWVFTAKEMLSLERASLLEIASGHPLVNHQSDGVTPSTEAMWDELLTSGKRIYGVAVDDAHNFREEFTIERANPGRAWVVVRAEALSRESILAALEAGDFYASTGVSLKNVDATSEGLTVEIEPASTKRYRVVFIGAGGSVLASSNENPARYRFQPSDVYVRARVEDSSGLRAWTQPVFSKASPSR